MADPGERVEQLIASADRCDSLAETAEMMGDDPGAERFRALASTHRLAAMELLDD